MLHAKDAIYTPTYWVNFVFSFAKLAAMFSKIILYSALLILTVKSKGVWQKVNIDTLDLDDWVDVTDRNDPSQDEFNKIMLDAHNELRSKEAKEEKASNMKKMITSQALVRFAENHVNKCRMQHSSYGERTSIKGFDYVGENINAGGFPNWTYPVESWYSEKKYYSYDNGCEKGQVCGHYTQVVWANSDHLGCAFKKCGKSPFSYRTVCVYAKGGNYRGAKPYMKGEVCGTCKEDCKNSLCPTEIRKKANRGIHKRYSWGNTQASTTPSGRPSSYDQGGRPASNDQGGHAAV